ncbi:ecto-NOX disulfide-thiol exchanger 2-like [Biomphalaria glabrata]|uniref:Ecto-NOX disulfide-thiol exchanger 2-like n=1 Tax=Biomphalaria glabrata TaxID=6526 RepID=A0A2C9KSL2_BIOGL|nr:ecto-NOX disulfide-thiol exchanger 2-like [Biomphalaria glabrata]XP_013079007.1 ecto-NOX disulfide-thiol exchanger 2-like [Biomphalaria glabrata]XP_055868506.1 ecto-NOX disulfide-thiol exchanger 2-like [Biomphalaria glabrata]XP_055868507.1 ecto-NOX disulfide-thiol exchanger 2-like [Biomphalaria glabrata]KAI8772345.1 ecto-NOX disulfide-thiol exchanger 2 [Biomphalaria glabrata]
MDPSRNNLPLQFNMNKNKPVIRNSSEGKEDDVTSSTNLNMMNANENAADQQQNNMIGVFNMLGQMVAPLGGDHNMMMMGPMNFNNFGGIMGPGPGPMMGGMGPMGGPGMLGPAPPGMMGHPLPIKEIIRLKSSVLYPPPPSAPPRSTRERPPGCRTIFIGGIPENCTEEYLFEVFESCGPIQSIRISKKNFAHIRFENMDSVDRALYISGYRMKIKDSDDKEDTGRLHVDYAQARDDQFEFECHQRALAREMRHIQRLEEERLRPPSPPPVTHYSDHEASLLLEKLKLDDNFIKASQVLITWLERGECNRRTATSFYSMVQNVHSHVRRLTNEKTAVQEEYERYQLQVQQRIQCISSQLCQVERVLAASHKQKCWDHFTKAQRKNIDTWQRQAQELRENDNSFVKVEASVEDMDFSDDEDSSPAKKRKTGAHSVSDSIESQKLKEENDALKCQMEAFKNEVDMVRQEWRTDVEDKDKQIKALQNALQGMQQQLIAHRAAASRLELEREENKSERKEDSGKPSEEGKSSTEEKEEETPSAKLSTKEDITVSSSGLTLTDKEAKMIGLICCFLHVHPHGATVDYLWSYLRQILPVRTREVEDLLEKMPSIFDQEIIGVGAAIERRWIFTALKRGAAVSSP